MLPFDVLEDDEHRAPQHDALAIEYDDDLSFEDERYVMKN